MIIAKYTLNDGSVLYNIDTVEDADFLIGLGLDISEMEAAQVALESSGTTLFSNNTVSQLNNPLVHIPFTSDLKMAFGAGVVSLSCATGNRSYIDRYGVMRYAGVNEARIEKEGILIEEAGTNLAIHSQNYSNWTTSTTITLSSSTEIAPDGTATAGKFIWASGQRTPRILGVSGSVTASSGLLYSTTIFIKSEGFSWVRMQRALGDGSTAITFVNLGTQEIGAQTNCTVKTKKLAYGFTKITMTYVVAVGGAEVVAIYPADTNADYATVSDGTKGYTIGGIQIEQRDSASSYIKTDTTAVTRAKEVCSIQFNNNMPAIGENYTVIADVTTEEADNAYIFRVDGETTRAAYIYDNSTLISKCGTTQDPKGDIDFSKTVRIVSRLSNMNLNSGVNGVLTGSTRPTDLPTGAGTSIILGGYSSSSSTGFLNGHIKHFKIYENLSSTEVGVA